MERGAYTPEGKLVSEVNFEIFKVNTLLLQGGDRMIKSTSLTIARWLMLLALEERPITAAQAARLMGSRRQSAQHLVDALASAGLVELIPNQNHRRAMLARLTDSGRESMRRADAVCCAAANELAEGLSAAVLSQVKDTLVELRRRIKEMHRRHFAEEKCSIEASSFPRMSEDLENRLRSRHASRSGVRLG
jgi:DNA-binding MarR family transcriptional regulator